MICIFIDCFCFRTVSSCRTSVPWVAHSSLGTFAFGARQHGREMLPKLILVSVSHLLCALAARCVWQSVFPVLALEETTVHHCWSLDITVVYWELSARNGILYPVWLFKQWGYYSLTWQEVITRGVFPVLPLNWVLFLSGTTSTKLSMKETFILGQE
jgi:hypothetical protein